MGRKKKETVDKPAELPKPQGKFLQDIGRDAFTKELDGLIKQISVAFGDNSIYQPGKHTPLANLTRISTGNAMLDYDLGGGIPAGRIILVTGPFSAGKTYFTTKCLGKLTQMGGRVGVIDEERTWDPIWAQKCGVDPDRCWVGSGEYSEKSMDLAELLVGSGEFDAILVDSLAAMVPKKVLDEAHEDHQMGVEAKLNAKFFRKLLSAQDLLERKGKVAPTIFVINQIRKKIGIAYGNPEVLPGGEAQMYYASIWMDFRASETILNKNDDVVGMYFDYNIKKNKTAPPRRKGTVGMFIEDFKGMHSGDWDFPGSVIDLAVRLGLLVKEGKWYKSALLPKNFMYANLWAKVKAEPSLERKIVEAVNDMQSNPVKIAYQPRSGDDTSFDEVEEVEDSEEGDDKKPKKGKKGKK